MCKSVFFISFQSFKTVESLLEVLEKYLNFTQTCLFDPGMAYSLFSFQVEQN